jgi:hypothetical protein
MTFSMARSYIAGPGEMSISVLLNENPLLYPTGSAREWSVSARKVPYRAAHSK